MFKITLKGIRAHTIRFLLTSIAVIAGVAFVVGSFTLTDSVRSQFDQLFTDINANIDLTIRSQERFDTGAFGVPAPVPADLAPEVEQVEGVEAVQGTAGGIPALVVNAEGEAVSPIAGPPLGINWPDQTSISQVTLTEGEAPAKDGDVLFDERLFDEAKYQIGDTVTVQTLRGNNEYRLSGKFKFGENNSLAGAYLVAFTTAEAQRQFNLEGKFQEIQIGLARGGSH
jgi:putative ABC transport system permease protein